MIIYDQFDQYLFFILESKSLNRPNMADSFGCRSLSNRVINLNPWIIHVEQSSSPRISIFRFHMYPLFMLLFLFKCHASISCQVLSVCLLISIELNIISFTLRLGGVQRLYELLVVPSADGLAVNHVWVGVVEELMSTAARLPEITEKF